uniref:Reverse transcriptase domain-containing protein n=1 Tax=Tanacetum cinerariifolium TaxID=118510 RepID=A0A6L2KWT8_TANCI|nr:reverse transcriptase domain-containing protein [Tanacetum cinerariifolium]
MPKVESQSPRSTKVNPGKIKVNPDKAEAEKAKKIQQASPAIVEPLRIKLPFLEDQFQEVPSEDPPKVPMADNRTMAELLQASTEGYEDAIVIPEITTNNFELKHDLINLVQNKQFFGYDKEDLHAHIRYFNKITSTMRVPNVPSSLIKLMLFPFSFEGDSLNSAADGNFLEKIPRECLKIIKSKSKVRQSRAKAVVAKVSTSSSTRAVSSKVAELKDMVRALLLDKKNQSSAPAHSPTPAQVKAMANLTDMLSKFVSSNTASSSGSRTLPSNTITNPKEDLKGITTRSGVAYQGPTIPAPSKVVKQGTEPVVALVSVLMPNLKPSIPYPSRRDNEIRRDQANEQIEKFYEIFKDMSFEISFTDALILMPKFASTIKALIGNKEKLSKMARTPMNKHYSVVIPNKLPIKLGDPGKFLIPCEFPGMDECLALADLGASINLMPLSVWEGLLLLELTSTCMTLELADLSVSKPIGIAKYVSVKLGVFHFLTDFVVVDFEPDPRVPLILGRCFLKTSRALIDVHKGELTLRIKNEAITYNLDQTARYSANYNQMTANKFDVICKEYSQKVLGFSDVTASGNPTPYDDPIVSTTSLTLTLFEDSDFLLFEEADAFLSLEDDPNSPKINPFYYDPEGDILLLEAILNSEPLPPLLNHEQYLPSFKKELKVCEAKTVKSSVDEPPEVKLKDLPPHLEYAFLEGDNKLLIIIAKEMGDEEKSALIKVLKRKQRSPVLTEHLPIVACLSVCAMHRARFKGEKSHFMVKEGIIFGHKISKNGIKVDRAKVDVIAKLPHPTTVKDCIKDFQMLKKKLTEALILIALNWDLPFELMCDASDFAIGAVLGCQGEIASVGLLLQEFDFKVLDTKGVKNLAADHLSRLENPYENVLYPKEINETFPLKTLSMVTFRGDSSASWFADFANYHAGNFIVKVMLKYGVTHRLSTAYHPQTSGQVEVSNHGLKRILERTIGENRASWSDKLDDALWAFRTAYKTAIGCTPYKLVYGKACRLPIKLEHKAYWALKLKIFSGKLKTRWSVPFTITKVFPYGTVELSQANEPNFKVNSHRVKHYFGGDVPQLDCLDCKVFRALRFVLHSQELHILSYILGIPAGVFRLHSGSLWGLQTPDDLNRSRLGFIEKMGVHG